MGFMSPKKPSLSDQQKEEQRKVREAQEAQQAAAEAERVSETQSANAAATKDLRQRRGLKSLISSGNKGLGAGGRV